MCDCFLLLDLCFAFQFTFKRAGIFPAEGRVLKVAGEASVLPRRGRGRRPLRFTFKMFLFIFPKAGLGKLMFIFTFKEPRMF